MMPSLQHRQSKSFATLSLSVAFSELFTSLNTMVRST